MRLGVTGHRSLPHPEAIVESVSVVLNRVRRRVGGEVPAVVSSLAEGADRVVAREALARGWSLEVLLPFPAEEYERDFAAPDSKREFRDLLARASRVEVASGAEDRREAYRSAGRRVVDACDALVAVWDGKRARGRGGTAEIVAYARDRGRPLYWIHSETGVIEEERTGADEGE